jgi:phosphoglycolate phosphatase-like HAD superfamily hydrolase
MTTTLLFDIDGTLCTLAGAGRSSFEQACLEVFGWEDACRDVRFAGATDLGVLFRLAKAFDTTLTEDSQRSFFQVYAEYLDKKVEGLSPSVFDGVAELLAQLSTLVEFHLGLVTGNAQATARIKLEHAGLFHHFRFGGFGDEVADRKDIAARALERGRRMNPSTAEGSIFLVGDTPSDIHAARAVGATSVVVATGPYSVQALEQAGGDFVFADLTDLDAFLSVVRGI